MKQDSNRAYSANIAIVALCAYSQPRELYSPSFQLGESSKTRFLSPTLASSLGPPFSSTPLTLTCSVFQLTGSYHLPLDSRPVFA